MQRLAVRERLAVVATVAAVVTLLLRAGMALGLFSNYRAEAVDALFPAGRTDDRIAVVAIDHDALAETDLRWPWPRDVQAELVRRIAAQRPAVIALDIVYDPATAEDRTLAAALRDAAAPVVLAQASQLSRSRDNELFEATQIAGPVATVASGADVGDTAITPDSRDGTVRTVPLAVESATGAFVPSFSLATISALDGVDPFVILRPNGVQVGRRTIPTEEQGRMRVAYSRGLSGSGVSRSTVSAADLLNGVAPANRLTGKIVFVGVTDPTLGDQHTTPVDKGGAPGVYVHANAVNTMLTAAWLAPESDTATTLWIAVLAVLVAASATLARVWLAPLLAAIAAATYFVIVSVRFDRGTEMDILNPLAAVGLALFGAIAARYLLAGLERRRMIGVLEQYVPPPMARELMARKSHVGASEALTFLFTDVVGSTELWERWPRDMSVAMHRHDVIVENAIRHAGGAVVRPRGEGDSRFAVFVRPIDAAHGAIAVDRDLAAEQWPTPVPITVRIGVHSGGAELRAGDYYGTDVNRCARIRGLAGAGQIYLSATTTEMIRHQMTTALLVDRGAHELKGIDEPEHVYELVWRVEADAGLVIQVIERSGRQ